MTDTRTFKGRNMKEFSFNINEIIKVRLTDIGKDILHKHFSELHKYCASIEPDEYILHQYSEDDKGYICFQLWDFMYIFGSYFMLGTPLIIQGNDIIFSEKDLHEVN